MCIIGIALTWATKKEKNGASNKKVASVT